jgi:TRAP-type uncharacterized transport system fused permease subunit
MRTSVESFRMGLAAFIVPFMFFSSPALLMQGGAVEIAHVVAGALLGVYLLSAAVLGWLSGPLHPALRLLLVLAAVAMIDSGFVTDAIGLGTAALVWAIQRRRLRPGARGSD